MSGPVRRAIRRLDAATVARIAAGEVVEGPASVVKELVENAYDAGATEVRVELWGGGIDRIRVSDDGIGIPPPELPLAVERHATSKLAEAEELEEIRTLGFRGEALASIASVSHLAIVSRPPGADSAHGVRLGGGTPIEEFVEGRPPGTTVEVRDLFFNTPARRKFLRGAPAEQVEIARLVGALYLARPGVALTLASEGEELGHYPRTDALADAAVRVIGEELLDHPLEGRSVPLGPGGPNASFVLGRPTLSRSSFGALYVSVNGRVVQSRPLQAAVRLAYDDYLPKGRYPVGAVHLEVELARVDVNVHPTKREVRIAREREVAEGLRRAVRSALQAGAGAAEAGPRPIRPFYPPSVPSAPPAASNVAGAVWEAPGSARRTATARLEELEGPRSVPSAPGHPRLKLLGSLFRLYWVAESEDALILVDQHAASERVVYEALRSEGRLARQTLVQPVTVPLTARQAAAWKANRSEIEAGGYDVEPFGGSAYRVASTPVYRGHLARADSLPALLDEIADGGRGSAPAGWVERRAASIACHAAVRGGDEIRAEEMGRILDALYRLPDASYACPHGRPILVRLDRRRLDQWFLRSPP
jgi:DNA mismatch repair protein MutL